MTSVDVNLEDDLNVYPETTESLQNEETPLLGSPTTRKQGWRNYIGIFLTIAASAQFSLGLMVVKLLHKFHPFMIMFWRFVGLTPIIPLVMYYSACRKNPIFSTIWPIRGNWQTLLLITVLSFAWTTGGALVVYSIEYISLADTSTITYSTPVFVSIASHWILGEKTGIVGILCGFITLSGVVVITRPPIFTGTGGFDTNVLIGSGFAAAGMSMAVLMYIVLRSLREVHYTVIILFISVCGVIQSAAMSAAISKFEVPNDLHDWLLIGAVASLYFIPQMCLTLAFKYEEAGTVSLFRTFDILFAFLWQYIILGDAPDWISVLGGSIVISGVLLAALRKYLVGLPPESDLRKFLWFIMK